MALSGPKLNASDVIVCQAMAGSPSSVLRLPSPLEERDAPTKAVVAWWRSMQNRALRHFGPRSHFAFARPAAVHPASAAGERVNSTVTQKDAMSTTIFRPAWWEWLILALLLLAFAWMTLAASPQKSASFDEQFHLTAGYAYWKTGDFRLATTHPPLSGLIASIPLLGDKSIVLPLENQFWEQGNRWDFSDAFFWYTPNDVPWILERARWGMIALGLLLVTVVWAWGRSIGGWLGGVVAGVLASFDPNLLANSRQVTTDIPLTLFLLLTLWLVWLWLRRPHWWLLILAGLSAGLAVIAKYNGLLIAPLVLLTLLLYPFPAEELRLRKAWTRLGALLVIGALAVAVLWATYRFTFGEAALFGITLPLPAPFYWNNLGTTVGNLLAETEVKPDFLLGEVSSGGWWYYFPAAIAVKTPLPLLLLSLAGIVTMLVKGGWRVQAALWLPVMFFLGMGLTGILTIGYRHILPMLPFMAVLAANTVRWLDGRRQTARRVLCAVGGALLLWLVVATVRFFPNHDSYFNEVAGDWRNWSNLLVDSNLDWGQDLPALAKVMDEMGIARVNLAYFGRSAPEAYGVDYSPLPGYQRFLGGGREPSAYNALAPEPGWYAVSATALRLGTLTMPTVDLFAYFRNLEPIARAGYSIYLYYLPEDEPAKRTLFTGKPVWEHSANLLDSPTGRVQAKWRQGLGSRIVPRVDGEMVAPAGEGVRAVDAVFGNASGETVFTLPWATVASTTTRDAPLPVTLYWVRGDGLMPMPAPTLGEPVSAFVHLIPGEIADPPGEIPAQVAQADGWDFALRGLETGDLIEQKLTLYLPADLAPGVYTVLTGLYSPQDWQRLTASQERAPAAALVGAAIVGTVEVIE